MFIKRTKNNLLSNWWLGVDKIILLSVIIFTLIGVFASTSASIYIANRRGIEDTFFINKMIIYIPIGLILILILSSIKTRYIYIISIISFVILFFGLFLTLFFNETGGAKRWIILTNNIKFQPSEYLKPMFAILSAIILSKIELLHKSNKIIDIIKNKSEIKYILYLISITIALISILLKQPDIGMTLTFLVILGSELFVFKIQYKYIALSLSILIPTMLFITSFMPHATNRYNKFITKSAEQSNLSIKAIENTNLFLGGHNNNLIKNIPDVHTDFIFTVIIEEWGIISSLLLIGLFFAFLQRIYKKTSTKKDKHIVYSIIGITSQLTFQILVHISSVIGIIPTKGMTLPFISYGGSSFISSCICIGFILSLLQDQNNSIMLNKNILIAAGGTGGHLFPASSIKEKLEEYGYKVFLITDKRGKKFSNSFSNIYTINGRGLSGESFFYRVKSLFKLSIGFIQSFYYILKIDPSIILGMGGYISVPVILLGKILGKKTIIHNADSILGNANILLSKFADITCISFKETQKISNQANIKFTGLPIRNNFLKLKDTTYQSPQITGKFNIVIMGGSQGAEIFSIIIPKAISKLNKNLHSKLKIYQQTVDKYIDTVTNIYKNLNINAEIKTFFNNPEQLLNISTIFIGRAGASTVLEVGTLGRPSIFIPILHKDKQQYINAEQITKNGGGIILDEKELNIENLYNILNSMLNNINLLENMAKKAKIFPTKNNASENIVNLIEELIKTK